MLSNNRIFLNWNSGQDTVLAEYNFLAYKLSRKNMLKTRKPIIFYILTLNKTVLNSLGLR